NSGGTYQLNATPAAKDLFTGQRWVVEIGLYDDRNRFMSTELGRFLQPDPIGFKGDASNLYRYCGNDWGNRTDPMGLLFTDDGASLPSSPSNVLRGEGFDRFGQTPLFPTIRVIAQNGNLILKQY